MGEKKKNKEESTGFKCLCGEFHVFPAYVFAHWTQKLIFTCPKSGAKYSILAGVANALVGK